MTREELIAKIEHFRDVPFDPLIDAIRAVVELHKPGSEPKDSPFKEHCKACNKVYPCKTIQAIEKELQ